MRGETPPPAPAAAPTRQQVRGWRYPSVAPLVAGVALIIGGLVAAGPGRHAAITVYNAFTQTEEQPPPSAVPKAPEGRKPEKPATEQTTTTSSPGPTVLPGVAAQPP